MKALLLQLPIQGHDFFFSRENVPLAAAYLKAIGVRKGVDIDLVPRHLMSYGDDQAILQFLLDARPDIVGMSCYLWNVERSLFLARQLKAELPGCRVILGGPEITPDNNYVLRDESFDIAVIGEGEGAWKILLDYYPRIPEIPGLLLRGEDGGLHSMGRGKLRHIALDHWPSPFLSGTLDPQLDDVLWLETVRGCVYRCAYCYYHKQTPRLRSFPLDRIVHEIRRARTRGFKEIVFLDPCFVKRPGLDKLLDAIGTINGDRGLRFSAECNVEDIDQPTAKKMGKAGFAEMEVGLQSIKPSTLRLIHRRFRPERFLSGVRYLQDHGIKVMVDIIAGLPGDTLSDICRSLDWVLEHEAYDFLMLYPLSLLPGTELKQRAHDRGLSAMVHPPYLVTRGPGLSAQEIHKAFHYYEECMEEDISPLEMPPALDRGSKGSRLPGGLRNTIRWHKPEEVLSFFQIRERTAYSLTISLTREMLKEPTLWFPVLREHLRSSPFSLLSIEVPADAFPEELEPLWQLSRERPHPLDLDYTVPHTPYRSIFLFSRSRGLTWKWPDPRELKPVVLPDGQEVSFRSTCLVAGPEKKPPRWFLDHMARRYPSLPDIRIWEPPDD